jgi:PAS domain-containing protein
MASQPVEMILARNLVSGLDLASFLIDADGVIVFFNDAAGELVGRRFEEVGRIGRDEWGERFGPFDELGELIPNEDLPLTVALRTGLPSNGQVHMRLGGDQLVAVEVSALPLGGADGFKGALVVCWRADD